MEEAVKNKLPGYVVKVINRKEKKYEYCFLEEAEQIDMPPIDSVNWTFHWKKFWDDTDPDCETIIKCNYQGRVIGLIRFGLYPYGKPGEKPNFIFINHLQSTQEREITPVGQWLIWYAITIGLNYLTGNNKSYLLKLHSLEGAIPYYRDKIMMDGVGWITDTAGEDLYAFMFTRQRAKEFKERMEKRYGSPKLLP